MRRPIYMDSHATTPCDKRVVEAMLPLFNQAFGNASSRDHAFGWEAEALVERARDRVAALIGGSPREIVFTSGGTESDNLAIKGVAAAYGKRGRHIIASAIEHKAVLSPLERLRDEGFEITLLPVNRQGLVDPEALRGALRPDTILVSVMFANNEIGTIQPVRRIGEICKEHGVFYHCDAVQAAACERIDVQELGVDLLTLSGHKMYGPKGVGALFVRRRNPRVVLEPLLEGGAHERGLRAGTLNVPGIVGMGAAAELVGAEREADATRLRRLRNRLQERLTEAITGVEVVGRVDQRLPGSLHVVFAGLEGESLVGRLRGVAVSAGAACMSASDEPSHVMAAVGVKPELAATAIRFGLHRFTTPEDVDAAADEVIALANARLAERSTFAAGGTSGATDNPAGAANDQG
jgi:cysteine desulfurase